MAEAQVQEMRRRWQESRTSLREAGSALAAGRLDEAFGLFTRGHDLGDDNIRCHVRGHLGRARIEMRRGQLQDASLDAYFALIAIFVSPARRFRKLRSTGFPAP